MQMKFMQLVVTQFYRTLQTVILIWVQWIIFVLASHACTSAPTIGHLLIRWVGAADWMLKWKTLMILLQCNACIFFIFDTLLCCFWNQTLVVVAALVSSRTKCNIQTQSLTWTLSSQVRLKESSGTTPIYSKHFLKMKLPLTPQEGPWGSGAKAGSGL